MSPNDADGMANSVDPALFAQTCLSENLGKLKHLDRMKSFVKVLMTLI